MDEPATPTAGTPVTAARRGADLLAEGLAAAGVRRVFALSGNQIMSVFDACLDVPPGAAVSASDGTRGLEIVHTRHEAAAVFMAEAHAQVTGEVGVALVTAGPGLGNALGALMAARESETPLLLLSGDSPVALDGRGAFQALDQPALTAPIVKATLRPTTPDAVAPCLAEALDAALSGRPGPVHIALPADVLSGMASGAVPARARDGDAVAQAAPEPLGADIAALGALLGGAARPLVLTGPALSPTRAPTMLAAAEAGLDAPIVCLDSPRGLRDPAAGDLAGLFARADMVLCLGRRVDFACGFGAVPPFATDARWAVVDTETDALQRAQAALGARATVLLPGDPRAVLKALLNAGVAAPDRMAWRAEAAALRAARAPVPAVPTGAISAPMVAEALASLARDVPDPVLVCDGGEFGQWIQAGVVGLPRVINGLAGAIGAGPAHALAVAHARPDATVIAAMGDGSAGFHLTEFETAARVGAPFVCVVGSDGLWNAEHQLQLRDFGADRAHGCTLSPARYDRAAQALGAWGAHVTDPQALAPTLRDAVASRRPALVQVEIVPLPAPMPPPG
jgi:acetolactate synthase-1/2/3 large subunit